MLDDNQRIIDLFEEGQKREGGEASPYLQLREPMLQAAQDI